MSEQKKFRILSIDGGGIRGIIPATVLAELEVKLSQSHPDKKLHEHFDLICGTSTGAILALGIAMGIPAAELSQFYKDNAKAIFPTWKIMPRARAARVFLTTMYSNKALKHKLAEVFTAANNGIVPTLDDLKTPVCIPTFNGNDGRINVLKTRHHEDYVRDYKLPVHDVALSSASAPLYFPPHSFSFSNVHGTGSNVNMIDGGLFANNPALIGLHEATSRLKQEFSNIQLLSLGTGEGRHIIKSGWRSKDIWYWLLPKPRLLDVILDSQSQITEQYILFLRRTLQNLDKPFAYKRVQYDLGSDLIALNASDKKDILRLTSIGDELSKNNIIDIVNFLNQQ